MLALLPQLFESRPRRLVTVVFVLFGIFVASLTGVLAAALDSLGSIAPSPPLSERTLLLSLVRLMCHSTPLDALLGCALLVFALFGYALTGYTCSRAALSGRQLPGF